MSWAQIYTSKHTIKFCRNRNIKIAKSKLLNNYNNLMVFWKCIFSPISSLEVSRRRLASDFMQIDTTSKQFLQAFCSTSLSSSGS